MDESKNKAVKPPLARLPSFNTNATIIGFVVYSSEVSEWLAKLSKNARRYFLSHEKLLRAFLAVKPELTSSLRFGDDFCEQKHVFPNKEEFKEVTHYREYGKLVRINYKQVYNKLALIAV